MRPVYLLTMFVRDLRYFLLVAIGASLSATAFSQNIQFHALDEATVERRLQTAPKTNELREAGIEQLFADAGCAPNDITREPVKKRKFSNVICTLPGDTDRTILVTAHYDKVAEGQGVVDNWTGVALLADLRQSLQGLPHKHRIMLISFCCEEEGLVGSQSFVAGLTKEEAAKISAIINIDSLGLSPTKLWVSKADKHLSTILLAAAQTMNLPLSGMDVDKVGSADSESFEKLKIPRMTLHSVTQDTFKVLHSPLDQFKSVRMPEYYDSYKLIAAFVSLADSTLDTAPSTAPPAK
jgi:hypothetical protein